MNEIIERAAEALERADTGYSISLTRLVDGESTYTAIVDGQEPREFPSYDEASQWVGGFRRYAKVRAVIAAMREPTEQMKEAVTGFGSAIDDWRSMIDAALAG